MYVFCLLNIFLDFEYNKEYFNFNIICFFFFHKYIVENIFTMLWRMVFFSYLGRKIPKYVFALFTDSYQHTYHRCLRFQTEESTFIIVLQCFFVHEKISNFCPSQKLFTRPLDSSLLTK